MNRCTSLYLHTNIHTYIMQTYIHANIHKHPYSNMQIHVYTHIHKYIYTYIHMWHGPLRSIWRSPLAIPTTYFREPTLNLKPYEIYNPTLKRFFVFHFLFPLPLCAFTLFHICNLHVLYSNNLLRNSTNNKTALSFRYSQDFYGKI